jgi:hypothetical protein
MRKRFQDLPEAGSVDARKTDSTSMPFYRDALAAAIFTVSFAVYLLSMPKTVALEDDSIFILSGYFNGVSHPPGYPLYTLVLHLFTQIPIGDIPARAHASSAFFAALACCSLFYILCLTGLERRLSALATLVFAFSATFWSQAIITEVYSLNVFLNLCLLLLGLRIHLDFEANRAASSAMARNFMLFSLAMGLAVSNHWPLTVLAAPAYLLLVARPFFKFKNKLIAVLPGLVAGAVFYGWLYINNQSGPFINFNGKFAGFGEFIDFVLRSHYASVDFQSTAGWFDKLQFVRDLALQSTRELNLLLLFSLLGFYRLIKFPETRIVGLAVGWAVIANSVLLALLVDFDYSDFYWQVFRVYPIVSIAMLFVLAGYGMAAIDRITQIHMTGKHLVIVLLAALALNALTSIPINDRHDYAWGKEYAQKIFEQVPENATLFSDGEIEAGLLGYYHFIKGQRPDITLYSSSALLFDNRLFDYRLADKKQFIETLVRENPQQAFYVANNYYGLETVTRNLYVDRLGKPETEPRHTLTTRDIDLLMQWSAPDYTRDPWTRIAITQLRHRAIFIMTAALKQASEAGLEEYLSTAISGLVRSDTDVLHFLEDSMRGESAISPGFYQARLADIDRGGLHSKQEDSRYVYLAARAAQAGQTRELIENSRRQACQNWPSPKNTFCRQSRGD